MSKNLARINNAYKFFCNAEESKLQFTLEDIAAATGWKLQTVQGYRTKKWHWFLREKEGKFFVEGLTEYPKQSFIRIHAQRTDDDIRRLRPRFNEQIDNLIDKARESVLLGVQAYNNPLATFRTPGYLVLMNIAFTALFHAIFERDGIDYTYKNLDGTLRLKDDEPSAWELSSCIKEYFKGTTTPERENLNFLIKLRNKIEHRYLPYLDITVMGHCQAMLHNFEALLVKEFGPFFALKQSLTLALQLSEVTPLQRETLKRLQSKEYQAIRQYIDTYQSNLPPDILHSQNYSFRVFLIPRLGNHSTSSDAAIEFIDYDPDKPEEMKQIEKLVALVKEKQIQVANQGKLRPTQVVERIKEATGKEFNMAHHTNAWKLYKARPRNCEPKGCQTNFCQYDEPHRDFVYTEQWVQFLIKKVNNPTEFEKIKSYRDLKLEPV